MSKQVKIVPDQEERCKFDKNNKLRCRMVTVYGILGRTGGCNVWGDSLKEAKQFCIENGYTIVEDFSDE